MSADRPGNDVAAPASATDILDTQAAGGRAIRGSALRLGGYGLGLLLSLIAVPFMIRHLGAVEYGYYVTVSSLVFIVGTITEAGLTNLGIREVSALDGHARAHLLRHLVGLRFALTAVGIALAVAVTWATGAKPPIVSGTAIVGLGLLIILTQQTYVIPLNVQLRFGWITVLDIVRNGTLSGTFIVLVVVGAGLTAFYWANVLAGAVLIAVTLVLVRRHADLRPAFDPTTWKRVIRETLPYAAAGAVGVVYSRIAVVLMSYVSTGEETGIYSAAFRIIEVIGHVPWLLVTSMLPILARAARDDERRLGYAVQRLFEMSLIIGSGLALTLAVGAPFAIAVIAGEGFEGSVPVLRILALMLLTIFLAASRGIVMLSLRLYREILLSNLVAAAVVIAGTLALAPQMGADGAALATAAAGVSLAVTSFYFLRRANPSLAQGFGVVPKVVLAAAVAGAAAIVLPGWPSLVLAAVAAATFAAIVVATRAVPPELFAALAGRTPDGPFPDHEGREP